MHSFLHNVNGNANLLAEKKLSMWKDKAISNSGIKTIYIQQWYQNNL
jgi:hypothetical protein